MAHEVATGPRGSGQITILGGISKGDIIVLRGAFAIKSKLTMTAMPDMEH
jgi:hypothetical protein